MPALVRRAFHLVRDRNLVDENGHTWTAARIASEFVIAATLMGVSAFFWILLP